MNTYRFCLLIVYNFLNIIPYSHFTFDYLFKIARFIYRDKIIRISILNLTSNWRIFFISLIAIIVIRYQDMAGIKMPFDAYSNRTIEEAFQNYITKISGPQQQLHVDDGEIMADFEMMTYSSASDPKSIQKR